MSPVRPPTVAELYGAGSEGICVPGPGTGGLLRHHWDDEPRGAFLDTDGWTWLVGHGAVESSWPSWKSFDAV